MRIAVIADTHNAVPKGLPRRLAKADEIWHLGDVCVPDTLRAIEALGRPLSIVLGNNDSYPWPERLVLEREGVRFLLIHIAPIRPPAGIDVVLHGHTHAPRDEMYLGARWLNPGCISFADRGAPPSFAWLSVTRGSPLKWDVVTL